VNSSRRRIYGDDHHAFRDSVKRFIATEVAPNLDAWRRANGVPRSIVAAGGDAGFLSTALPEEFGGGGTEDFGFLVVLIEETIAAGATGLALLWALQAGVTIPFLLEHAPSAGKAQWLPGLGAGQLIALPAPAELSHVSAPSTADDLLVNSAPAHAHPSHRPRRAHCRRAAGVKRHRRCCSDRARPAQRHHHNAR
jgi:acyl-CoA dehydrogenase